MPQNNDSVKKFIYIIDSMTPEELDGKVKLSESRKRRLAIGSGTSIEEVN